MKGLLQQFEPDPTLAELPPWRSKFKGTEPMGSFFPFGIHRKTWTEKIIVLLRQLRNQLPYQPGIDVPCERGKWDRSHHIPKRCNTFGEHDAPFKNRTRTVDLVRC
jgi:hypothetical protein